ncbi:MAG TPA: ABA4-like family protein [Planctomycetaceae bacterium]
MTDLLFSFGNLTAIVGWALLVLLPRWRGVAQATATLVVPGLLAVAYTVLIVGWWSQGEGGFGSLSDILAFFQTPELLLAGWLHYLAFDLFVGAWEARQARRDGVPHFVMVPVLLLTFLFGPAGYLASIAITAAWRVIRPAPILDDRLEVRQF